MSCEEKDFNDCLKEITDGFTLEFPESEFSLERENTGFWHIRYHLIRDGVKQEISLPIEYIEDIHYRLLPASVYVSLIKSELLIKS